VGVCVHICSRKHGPTPTCTKYLSLLNNTHNLGGCRYTAQLRIKRQNNTFLLQHQLRKNKNEGRWPLLGLYLGNQPVIDLSKHKIGIEETTPSHLPPIPHPNQGGLQDNKPNTTEHHHSIHEYILPAHTRPTGKKTGPRLVGRIHNRAKWPTHQRTYIPRQKRTTTHRVQILH
jgi:hypothetical protein